MTDEIPGETPVAEHDADFNLLLNALLPFALQQLARTGSFFPYGAAIDQAGELAFLSASVEQVGEHPSPEEVLTAIQDGARATQDQIRAFGFATHVTFGDAKNQERPAIRVDLDRRDGAVLLLFPYTVENQECKLADPMVLATAGPIWGQHE